MKYDKKALTLEAEQIKTYMEKNKKIPKACTLTTDEMPSHTHTQNAHSHTIGSLARYVITGGGTASVGDGYGNSQNYKTGSTTAKNKNTGGG